MNKRSFTSLHPMHLHRLMHKLDYHLIRPMIGGRVEICKAWKNEHFVRLEWLPNQLECNLEDQL